MKKLLKISAAALAIALVGCRSRVVEVNLINTSNKPLHDIIVDYPGATFGVNVLDAGKTYEYAIKPQDAGKLQVHFTDAQGTIHGYTGTPLHKDDSGTIEVRLSQDNILAQARISSKKAD